MAPASRIAELASIVQLNTTKVDEFLSAQGLPSPSFGIEALPVLPLPSQIASYRDAAIEAMDELHALLLGPMPSIFFDLTQQVRPQCTMTSCQTDLPISPPT